MIKDKLYLWKRSYKAVLSPSSCYLSEVLHHSIGLFMKNWRLELCEIRFLEFGNLEDFGFFEIDHNEIVVRCLLGMMMFWYIDGLKLIFRIFMFSKKILNYSENEYTIDNGPADGWCPLFRLPFFCDQVRRKSGPTVSSNAVCGPEQKRIGHIIRSHWTTQSVSIFVALPDY